MVGFEGAHPAKRESWGIFLKIVSPLPPEKHRPMVEFFAAVFPPWGQPVRVCSINPT
jgi:hypothetical protein